MIANPCSGIISEIITNNFFLKRDMLHLKLCLIYYGIFCCMVLKFGPK